MTNNNDALIAAISAEVAKALAPAIAAAVTEAVAQISAPVNLSAPAVEAAPVTQQPSGLKVLSKSEIMRLRREGHVLVAGKADWQLQGTKPANAVATGRVVSEKTLAKYGYKRPTGARREAIRAWKAAQGA